MSFVDSVIDKFHKSFFWGRIFHTLNYCLQKELSDCETVLDTYYEYPEGKARLNYRDMHPEVDARLVILRGLKPRSREAVKITQELLARYGLTAISTSTRVTGETIPATPQYKQPPSAPPPEGLKELLDLFK